MSPARYREMYLNVKNLRDNIRKSESLAWQILAHPEATDEQVLEVHRMVVKNRQQYARMLEGLVEAQRRAKNWQYDPLNLRL